MADLVKFIATLTSTIFSGAAIYITLVEHPARLSCSTECALSQWAPSYKRATVMQAPLALAAALAGILAWAYVGQIGWLLGAVCIFAVVPFTLLAIRPTNQQLLEPGRDPASKTTRALLVRWGRLHAVRTAAGLVASATYLWLLVRC